MNENNHSGGHSQPWNDQGRGQQGRNQNNGASHGFGQPQPQYAQGSYGNPQAQQGFQGQPAEFQGYGNGPQHQNNAYGPSHGPQHGGFGSSNGDYGSQPQQGQPSQGSYEPMGRQQQDPWNSQARHGGNGGQHYQPMQTGRSQNAPYAGQGAYGQPQQGNYGDQGYQNQGHPWGGAFIGSRDNPGNMQGGGHNAQGEQHQMDPDYRQWREQQMQALDKDYREWRGDRYKKFSEEFDGWRKSRSSAGGSSTHSDSESDRGTAGANQSGSSTGTPGQTGHKHK